MSQYRIVDDVTYTPGQYVQTWNSTTGEVLTMTTTVLSGIDYGSSAAQSAAITLINGCPANEGRFIGHAPNPH